MATGNSTSTDTVDFFREREKDAWNRLMETYSVEALLEHSAALRALNAEIETRVQMLLEAGRIVRTSGKRVAP